MSECKIYAKAKRLGLTEVDRWSEGIAHHPRSEEIMKFLQLHDFNDYEDFFYWKVGGDGDNGETLMYQLDTFFDVTEGVMPTKTEPTEAQIEAATDAVYKAFEDCLPDNVFDEVADMETAEFFAKAALKAAGTLPNSQWQPIETAPKDGTYIWLWDERLNSSIKGSFRMDEGFSGGESPDWFDDSYDEYSTGYASLPLEPTHWMPLPQPPAQEVV